MELTLVHHLLIKDPKVLLWLMLHCMNASEYGHTAHMLTLPCAENREGHGKLNFTGNIFVFIKRVATLSPNQKWTGRLPGTVQKQRLASLGVPLLEWIHVVYKHGLSISIEKIFWRG